MLIGLLVGILLALLIILPPVLFVSYMNSGGIIATITAARNNKALQAQKS
jgi:hypothetical protein